MLWNGTADSAVDLGPTNLNGINESEALGTNGTQQVGFGYVMGTSNDQAILWNGTAASAVDLNPSGYSYSEAFATNGTFQVGYGRAPGPISDHALLWAGTAGSVINLQTLLPSTVAWTDSIADSIDSSGNIYGFGNNNEGGYFAVEWSPLPEPATGSMLLIVSAGFLMRRRGKYDCVAVRQS
jgi:hypothetical protein